ncbi:MAG TPA: hypothetical protein VMI56_17135 [Reyranella sp.]|nr:hypothetical protein [Reyranella sp.]
MTEFVHGISRTDLVLLDAGELLLTTWGQFVDDNQDPGDVDFDQLARDMLKLRGCTAFGGGGATPVWSMRLIERDDVDGIIGRQATLMGVHVDATPLWKQWHEIKEAAQ